MKAYKDYMDRIGLDEEQHQKLLEAVKAAEAAAAEGRLSVQEEQSPEETKIRRFPLKKLGLIASAAAVVVIVVSVSGGLRGGSKESTVTYAAAPELTASTGSAQTMAPVTQAASDFRNDNSTAYIGTASADPIEEHDTMITEIETRKTASPEAVDGTFVFTAEDAAGEELGAILKAVQPSMKTVTMMTAQSVDVTTVQSVAEFVYEDVSYSYYSETGFLYAEGMGCFLPDEQRDALNRILAEYPADK